MNDKDEKVAVTIQWYKANVVRLVFNGRVIWETKEIALDDIARAAADTVRDAQDSGGPGLNGVFRETTLRLDALEATNYSRVLLQGLQVERLEKINLLVQLRVEQWQMKVLLFERQLKQRMVNLGLAELLKAINPDDPDGYVDDDPPCGNKCGRVECDGACNDIECGRTGDNGDCGGDCDNCDGAYCESLGIDDIESDDDTLRMCKGCDGVRDSCAGCPDADPDDRYMNDGDMDMQKNNERARLNDKRAGGVGGVGGVGLADSDGIYQR